MLLDAYLLGLVSGGSSGKVNCQETFLEDPSYLENCWTISRNEVEASGAPGGNDESGAV